MTLGTRPGDWGMEQRRMLSDAHVGYGVRYMVHTAISRRLSEKLCTRQSRKVIWDMIDTLFLTL